MSGECKKEVLERRGINPLKIIDFWDNSIKNYKFRTP